MACPDAPRTVYELNTRVWLRSLGVETLADVPDPTLDQIAGQGFDHVWLMGVWAPSAWSRRVALAHGGLRGEYLHALPDGTDDDVVGSPYAVADYRVSPVLGGDAALAAIRQRLRDRGVRLLLDFVPNHTACDHPWLTAHPWCYVQPATGGREDLHGDDVFSTASGERVFHGRDPYFPPWSDTAQVDVRRVSTRALMTDALLEIAARCDGVRCDMAMLLLSEVFGRTWERLDVRPPPESDRAVGEFWPEAIDAVREVHPGFVFIAEAYWGTELRLQHLGFDFTYDKTLHDRLAQGDAVGINAHLAAGRGRQRRALRFIENHDEDRAAAGLALDLHPLAALLGLTLPGARLLHQGQLTGARRRLPVQLGRGPDEPVDASIARFYDDLLAALRDPVLARGSWRLLATREAWAGNPSHLSFVAYGWDGSTVSWTEGHRVLVVNLATHPAQCVLPLALPGLGGRTVAVRELLGVGATPPGDRAHSDGQPVYLRDGDTMGREGLFVELPGRCAQLLHLAPATAGFIAT